MQYLDELVDGEAATLAGWLLPRLEKAAVAGLRTGFLTTAGAEIVLPALTRLLERGGEVFAVVGGEPEQTEPTALREFARLNGTFPGKAHLYLAAATAGRQNGKAYYIKDEAGLGEAYVGSGNLTRGGLETNHEAAITIADVTDGHDAAGPVLAGIRAWCDHPASQLITHDVAEAFASQPRQWRIGGSHAPAVVSRTRPLAHTIPDALDWIEAVGTRSRTPASGIMTGFADLDALTNGFQPGSLTVVGGRPGMGKSVLLLDFCRAAALRDQIPAALFSLEMTSNDLNVRLLSAESGVPLFHIRNGYMNDDDWKRLAAKMAEVADAPLYINDAGTLDMQGLREDAARLVHDHGVKLIAIDYLQLMTPDQRGETREREVSDLVRQIKVLALDLGVAIVAAAQLNRVPEGRIDKRPQLTDFRESDAIAHAADLAILLLRDDAYSRAPARTASAQLIIAKNRHGPTPTIGSITFQAEYSRFSDTPDS